MMHDDGVKWAKLRDICLMLACSVYVQGEQKFMWQSMMMTIVVWVPLAIFFAVSAVDKLRGR